MMSRPAAGDPIYAVRAEAVPVLITAHRLGSTNYRIKFGRSIGWAPKRYDSAQDVLRAILGMATYSQADARLAKAMCTPEP